MGLGLKLIPVEHDSGTWGYGHSLLELGNVAHDMYEELTKLRETDPPDDFSTYTAVGSDGEPRYGTTRLTPYGESIRCVRAGELAPVLMRWSSPHTVQRAVAVYMQELDPKTKIALYWH